MFQPWDIWTFDFTEEQTHPAVLLGHPDRLNHPQIERVNVLLCSTLRGQDASERARSLKRNEVLVDEADGLDWFTIVKCDAVYFVRKSGLYQRRGSVSPLRRVAITRVLADALYLTFA
jgi:hypothetical protein